MTYKCSTALTSIGRNKAFSKDQLGTRGLDRPCGCEKIIANERSAAPGQD